MRNLEVNIGLNVGNTAPPTQGSKSAAKMLEYFTFGVHDYRIDTGEWWTKHKDAVVERTLVIAVKVEGLTFNAISRILSTIAKDLEQDAIAFKLDSVGGLAYSPSYIGEKEEYNENFFKSI